MSRFKKQKDAEFLAEQLFQYGYHYVCVYKRDDWFYVVRMIPRLEKTDICICEYENWLLTFYKGENKERKRIERVGIGIN